MGTSIDPRADLAVQLDLFSSVALKTIGSNLQVPGGSGSRATSLEALRRFIGTAPHREVLKRQLSQDDWKLLSLLPLRIGQFNLQLLFRRLKTQGLEDQVAYSHLARLLAGGCILPLQSVWGAQKLGIDQQSLISTGLRVWWKLAPFVAEWARGEATTEQGPKPVAPPVRVAGSALDELLRAVFVLLSETRKRPLRFTQQGMPNKTDLPRLAAALAGGEGRGGKRRATDPIPPLLFFAVAAMAGGGLFDEESLARQPAADAEHFFDLPLEAQVQRLFLGWSHSLFDDLVRIPTLDFGYGLDPAVPWQKEESTTYGLSRARLNEARVFLNLAIAETARTAPDGWYCIDQLAAFTYQQFPEFLFAQSSGFNELLLFGNYLRPPNAPQQRPYPGLYRQHTERPGPPDAGAPRDLQKRQLYMEQDWQEVEGAFVRQVLAESMRWLGMVEVGPAADAADCFHLTSLGQHILFGIPLPRAEAPQSGRAGIVQPSFEVIVTDAAAGFALLAQLDRFAERRGLDRAATYQLTQAALVRGLDSGLTGAGVLDTLEHANAGPLPQNVRYSLEEWIRLYERLSLRESASLLQTDTAGELNRWLTDPQLARMLGPRLGPNAVLVPSRFSESVIARIKQQPASVQEVDYAQKPGKIVSVKQPDRIELGPEHDEPYLRYRLATFSDQLPGSPRAITYRITRASVARAGRDGWTGERLVAFLQAASGGALPEELALRLLGWSGSLPPLRSESLVAVALPSKPIGWGALSRIPAIATLIRGLPAPELALVAPADLDRLREALADLGLSVQDGTIEAGQLKAEETSLRAMLRQHREEPQEVYNGLKAAGLIGKLDRLRWGY